MRFSLVSSLLSPVAALASLFLLTQSGCSGCGGPMGMQEGGGVFTGLEVATEMEGQATTNYVWARPTGAVVLCIKAPCPSFQVRGVDGSTSRFVHQFDLRSMGLSPSEESQMLSSMGRTLARGRFVNWRFQGQDIVVFQVVRAAEPGSQSTAEKPETDRYYQVKVAAACADDRCMKWEAKPLNPQLGATQVWDSMDMGMMGMNGQQLQTLMLKLRSRGGFVSAENNPVTAPRITQAFPNP